LHALFEGISQFGSWTWQGLSNLKPRRTANPATVLPLQAFTRVDPWSQSACLNNNQTTNILLCIDRGLWLTQLHQDTLQEDIGDRQLFEFLRRQYNTHRYESLGTMNTVSSWFTLRGVKSLSLSRVSSAILLFLWNPTHKDQFKVNMNRFASVHRHGSSCASKCVCIPPVERVDQEEYRCQPAPKVELDYSPAIATNELTHYFFNPHKLDIPQRSIYNQLPKRVRGQLTASTEEAQLGWGVYFEEGWDWGVISALLAFFIFPPLLFAILWSIFKEDIQGGFTIAVSWMSLGSFLLGYMAVKDSTSSC